MPDARLRLARAWSASDLKGLTGAQAVERLERRGGQVAVFRRGQGTKRVFDVTVPADWTSFEDSTGEFALQRVGGDEAMLLFWLDVYPIVDPAGEPVAGFDGTAKAVIDQIEGNPNVIVIEKKTGSLGGLEATTLEFTRSPKAVNVDKECPTVLLPCVGFLGFPQWDSFFGEGGPFHMRMVAVDATWGGEKHAIYAMIKTANDTAFADFDPAATEIIEGARLPAGVDVNR